MEEIKSIKHYARTAQVQLDICLTDLLDLAIELTEIENGKFNERLLCIVSYAHSALEKTNDIIAKIEKLNKKLPF